MDRHSILFLFEHIISAMKQVVDNNLRDVVFFEYFYHIAYIRMPEVISRIAGKIQSDIA